MAIGFNDGTYDHIFDKGLVASSSPRVLEVNFGDGYTQRLPNGINSITRSFSATFKTRTKAKIEAMESFFVAKSGYVPFTFTVPTAASEEDIQVVAKSWSHSYDYDGYWSLTVQLEECHQP